MALASEMWVSCLLPASLIWQHLEGKVTSTFLWYRSSYVAFSIWNFESLLRQQVLFVRLFLIIPALLKCDLNTIKVILLNYMIQSFQYIHRAVHPSLLIPEHAISLKQNPVPVSSPSPLFLSAPDNIHFLSLWICLFWNFI